MKIFEKQATILSTLLMASAPVAGTVLCKKSDLSLKTIKKEITLLNEYVSSYGFQIASHSGIGYEITVHNEPEYLKFKESFMALFRRNFYFRDDHNEQVHYIIRKLLSYQGNLYIEEIADDCYCSISVINRDMIQVKAYLDSYNLVVKNRTKNGLFLEGNEWDIRLAFIAEHKIYKNFIKGLNYKEHDFSRFFLEDRGLYKEVRAIIKEELMNHSIYIPYTYFSKVVYMILLSITRKRYADKLYLPEMSAQYGDALPTYAVTKSIYSRLEKVYDILSDDKDILTTAAYMHCYQLIRYEELMTFKHFEQIKALTEDFIDYFDTLIPIKKYKIDEFKKDLSCNLEMLSLKSHNHIHFDEDLYANFEYDGLLNTDMCLILSMFLKEKTEIKANVRDVLSFYSIFSDMTMSILNQYPIKILFVTRRGYYYSRYLARKIKAIGTNYDLSCFPVEYSDLEKIDLSQYDFLATDIDKNDTKDLPIQRVDVFNYRTKSEFSSFSNKVFIPKSCRDLDFFPMENMYYAKGLSNIFDVEKYIRQIVLRDFPNVSEYITEIKKRTDLLSPVRKNQTVILKGNRDILHSTFLKCIVLERPIKWGEGLCSFILIYNVKDNDFYELQYLSSFVVKFIHTDDFEFSEDNAQNYYRFINLMTD